MNWFLVTKVILWVTVIIDYWSGEVYLLWTVYAKHSVCETRNIHWNIVLLWKTKTLMTGIETTLKLHITAARTPGNGYNFVTLDWEETSNTM